MIFLPVLCLFFLRKTDKSISGVSMISSAINFYEQIGFLGGLSVVFKSSNKNSSPLLSLSFLIDEKDKKYEIESTKSGSRFIFEF